MDDREPTCAHARAVAQQLREAEEAARKLKAQIEKGVPVEAAVASLGVSLPPVDSLLDALNSFATALTWPEAQQRFQALFNRGLNKPGGIENRFGELLGALQCRIQPFHRHRVGARQDQGLGAAARVQGGLQLAQDRKSVV